MLNIDALRAYGADVDDGLKRCINNEGFYLDLVRSVIPDSRVEELDKAIAVGDLDKAFEIAHALKGMYSNLALTPLSKPVTEITELLRNRTKMDYSELMTEIKVQKAALDKIGI